MAVSTAVTHLPLSPNATHKPIPMGTVFGALRIDSEPFRIEGRCPSHVYYECVCTCGKRRPFYSARLTTKVNPPRSCGCGAGGSLATTICAGCGKNSKRGRLCGKCHYEKHPKQHQTWVNSLRNNSHDFLRWRLYQAKSKSTRAKSTGKKYRTVTITWEELKAMWDAQDGKCALSGLPMTTDKDSMYAASMDRIKSDGDYTTENVQLVCHAMNIAKGPWEDREFREFLRLLRSEPVSFPELVRQNPSAHERCCGLHHAGGRPELPGLLEQVGSPDAGLAPKDVLPGAGVGGV